MRGVYRRRGEQCTMFNGEKTISGRGEVLLDEKTSKVSDSPYETLPM